MDIRHLNTKADYEYVRQNFPKEVWKPKYQALLKERMQWSGAKKLANKTDGITKKDAKKVVTNKKEDGTEEHYQYEYKSDPGCALFRLGFTVSEANAVLTE